MGIKTTDLTPFQGPSALNPAPKSVFTKVFQVARTDTTASVKCVLPAGSSIIDFDFYGPASNAGTTAVLNIGSSSGTITDYINGQNVRVAGKQKPDASFSINLPNIENQPTTADLPIYAQYAETGGASSSGGPWKVLVWYIL